MDAATPASIGRRGKRTRERQPGRRNIGRGRSSLAVRGLAGGLAASLAAAALVAPAQATTKPALIAQAKAGMQRSNVTAEAHHAIPFKSGTKFTIACGFRGQNILCTEHAGPERCIKGRPWVLISDLFPVIHGRVGESLTYGLLTVTSNYCKAS
jgi:hypothetical protein